MHMSTLNTQTIAVFLLLLILHFSFILPRFTPSLVSVMGKLSHDTQITYFSHPHPLELNPNAGNPNMSTCLCAGCKLPANDPDDLLYSCNQCNYHLHLSCTNFNRIITHPAHPSHSLALTPVCTYPGAIFNCDACLRRGYGFNYHCNSCDFDLHAVCAMKPLSVGHHLHEHPLMLTFKNPYETKGFSCDICSKIGSKQWLYRCGMCEFDAHLHCATSTLPPPVPPQQNVGRNQSQVPAKRARTNSGSSGRLQGTQSFSAVANQPGTGNSQQSGPETMGFEYTGIGLQMQQSFPASAGRPNDYYGSGMQRQQSYPLTGGGGMQLQQSYPLTGGGSGMQRQQSYPLTGGGGMQLQQSYPLTGGGGMQQNQSYPLTGGGVMQRQQSYPLTGGGGMQQNQSYPLTEDIRMQPQMSYPGTGEGAMQQQQSYPLTGGMHQYYPVTGGGGFPVTGGGAVQMTGGGGFPVTGGGAVRPQQAYPAASGGLMNAAIQGLVEGAAQQVGQSFMQSLIGGNGGDGSSSSISVNNLGPTFTENQESSGTQDY